ncbi:MAG TPA: hypothetical protein VIK29_03220 [Paludibacter sp.]
MKLLIVTCLTDYGDKVVEMLTQVGIQVFSKTETTEFKETQHSNMLDNWYGGDNDNYNSIFFFSFTEQKKAESMIEAINRRNAEKNKLFPIRGFIMPVESYTAPVGEM